MKSSKETPHNYQVLARRFRPQQFAEILGQEGLVTTLKNSVKAGRVGHAYLFCGPRGVGKTTVARVLAKALNCSKGPTETPCDQCQNCQEIIAGNALDVLEIDGASNRGIDEIRNLRENVKYMAATGRYKIYIIDEVHMLTQEAFNALLKTLEEPPAHVKFLFATTDPQKLPATILSRCQKFELKRIPSALMGERLYGLAKEEKVKLSQDAALAIMQQAQGSMRDAESLLEVLIGSGQKDIHFDCVRDILGLSDQKAFFDAITAICGADAKGALKLIAEIFAQGREPSRFLAGFTLHLRNLLLVKVLGEKNDVLEMPREQLIQLKSQAETLGEEQLIALVELSTRTEQQMRGASVPRILLELFFMKALDMIQRPLLTDLLLRLEQMEARLKGDLDSTRPASSSTFKPEPPAAPTPLPSAPARTSLYDEDVSSSSTPLASEDSHDIKGTWGKIAQSFGATNPIIRSCMQHAQTLVLEKERLYVQLDKTATFQKSTLEDKTFQQLIESKLKEQLGRSVRIVVGHPPESSKATAVQEPPAPELSPPTSQPPIDANPALQEALRIFKGKVVRTTQRKEAN